MAPVKHLYFSSFHLFGCTYSFTVTYLFLKVIEKQDTDITKIFESPSVKLTSDPTLFNLRIISNLNVGIIPLLYFIVYYMCID